MPKVRPHFTLALLIAMLLLTAFTMPATAQGNPTKTPKPTNTVRPSATQKPSVTPRPSITPIGFNPIRADDFGGGGTILYSMDYSSLSAMDASGKNDRVVIPAQKIDSKFISWQFLSDGNTVIYTDFADLFLTDLKGRTPEKLPGFDKAAFFSLSPDRTHLAFSTRSDSGKATLFGYDIATRQCKELAKTSQRDGFSLLGWLDEGKHFLASGAAGTENILTERLYDVTDGSSVPFEAAWLKAGHPPFEGSFSRSPKGKFAYCHTRVVGLLNITDGTKTELASMPSGEICGLDPVWSPDERYILFGSGRRSGEFNRIPLTMQAVNVETKQVTLIKKFDPITSLPRIMSFDWFAAAP